MPDINTKENNNSLYLRFSEVLVKVLKSNKVSVNFKICNINREHFKNFPSFLFSYVFYHTFHYFCILIVNFINKTLEPKDEMTVFH